MPFRYYFNDMCWASNIQLVSESGISASPKPETLRTRTHTHTHTISCPNQAHSLYYCSPHGPETEALVKAFRASEKSEILADFVEQVQPYAPSSEVRGCYRTWKLDWKRGPKVTYNVDARIIDPPVDQNCSARTMRDRGPWPPGPRFGRFGLWPS